MTKELKEGDYRSPCGKKFTIPRMEFLLHNVKEIEAKIEAWYCEKFNVGLDAPNVRISNTGNWVVTHSEDDFRYQRNKEVVLTDAQFKYIMKGTIETENVKTSLSDEWINLQYDLRKVIPESSVDLILIRLTSRKTTEWQNVRDLKDIVSKLKM